MIVWHFAPARFMPPTDESGGFPARFSPLSLIEPDARVWYDRHTILDRRDFVHPTTSFGVSMSDESFPHDKPGRPEVAVGLEASTGEMLRRWVIVRHTTVWHPPTDVYELDDHLIVVVEVAGMRDGDFNVTLQGQQLTISGARQRVTMADCAYYQLEIPFGEFRTEVSLPWPVLREEVSARYRDGFLRVELPHAPAQKIQIVSMDVEEFDEKQDPG
jgi:HSP20 family protein